MWISRFKSYSFAGWIIFLVALSSIAEAKEKLSIDKNGIKVWTSQATSAPILQYRAETVFDASMENVLGLMLDSKRAPRWMPYVNEIKVLQKPDAQGNMLTYMRLDMPFPLTDRDLIAQGKIFKSKDGKVTIQNRGIKDNRYKSNLGLVRIDHYEGNWTFEQIAPSRVKVVATGYSDPGGNIPPSFVNTFAQQQPYQMFVKMQQQLKPSHYQLTDLPAILR